MGSYSLTVVAPPDIPAGLPVGGIVILSGSLSVDTGLQNFTGRPL